MTFESEMFLMKSDRFIDFGMLTSKKTLIE